MGPPEPTPEEIDKVYNRLIEVLDKEFDVLRHPQRLPGFIRAREEVLVEFRDVIGEILYQDNCEKF